MLTVCNNGRVAVTIEVEILAFPREGGRSSDPAKIFLWIWYCVQYIGQHRVTRDPQKWPISPQKVIFFPQKIYALLSSKSRESHLRTLPIGLTALVRHDPKVLKIDSNILGTGEYPLSRVGNAPPPSGSYVRYRGVWRRRAGQKSVFAKRKQTFDPWPPNGSRVWCLRVR